MKKVFIVIGVVALGAFLVFKMSSRPKPKSPKEALHAIMADPKAQDFQIRDAMVQLAYHQDPGVLKMALERAGSDNFKIRAGAGETLGFFETAESEAALAKLLDDPEVVVRLQAMRGLYHIKSPSRIALIRAQLKKSGLTEGERLKLKEVLFRASEDPNDRKDSVEALVAYARSGKTPQHHQAGQMAANLSPKDPGVQKYVRDMMRQGQEPAFVTTAIYLFADSRDPEISGNLRRYLKDPQASVRMAAINTISKYCQKDRFTALSEGLASEKDPNVFQLMANVLKNMPGRNAISAAEGLTKSGRLQGDSARILQSVLADLQANSGGRDPCDFVAGSKPSSGESQAPKKPTSRKR